MEGWPRSKFGCPIGACGRTFAQFHLSKMGIGAKLEPVKVEGHD